VCLRFLIAPAVESLHPPCLRVLNTKSAQNLPNVPEIARVRLQCTALQVRLSQDRLSSVRLRFGCRTIGMSRILLLYRGGRQHFFHAERRRYQNENNGLVSTVG
jgi:hypothetical protein